VDIQFTDSLSRFGEMWNFIKSSLKCSTKLTSDSNLLCEALLTAIRPIWWVPKTDQYCSV